MPIFRMPVVLHANCPHANCLHVNSPATIYLIDKWIKNKCSSLSDIYCGRFILFPMAKLMSLYPLIPDCRPIYIYINNVSCNYMQ